MRYQHPQAAGFRVPGAADQELRQAPGAEVRRDEGVVAGLHALQQVLGLGRGGDASTVSGVSEKCLSLQNVSELWNV